MSLSLANVRRAIDTEGGGRRPCLLLTVNGIPTFIYAPGGHPPRGCARGYALIHLPGLEDLLPLIPLPERREEPFAHGAELLRGHTDDPAVMWYAREFFALRDNDALGVEPFRAGPPLSHPPGYAPVTSA
jgi:hypothetical protein